MTTLVAISVSFIVVAMFALTGTSPPPSTHGKVDRFALGAVYVVTDGVRNAVRSLRQHV